MKKHMIGKKLRLNAHTIQALSVARTGRAAGCDSGQLTDVLPNCGTYNCPTTPTTP
ncbi:MAG TPA: hypothetical protein VGC42_13865 [Kofleriaceae bacterium]